jgi:large repetitive protein
VRRRSPGRFKLALAFFGVCLAVFVTGATAADFDIDEGPCRETPGEQLLLHCPTGYVGAEYELEIESEEGSGCTSPGNPYVWYEVVNSSLPPGLTMARDGTISGTPTTAGLTRFWIWNHDLTAAEGGPAWCEREDRSEHEFSIYIDPGLEINEDEVAPAALGQPYAQTLTTNTVTSLNPPTGSPVQATWKLASGSLPPGITLSPQGVLGGTPTTEGSYGFVVLAQAGGPSETKELGISVRQPMSVSSPFGASARPGAEVGLRFSATPSATGGTGTYEWSVESGELPAGLTLDKAKGTVSGTPQGAGRFAFSLVATDEDGRVATAASSLTVAPRLAIKTAKLKPATAGSAYRAKLATSGGVKPLKWKLHGKPPAGLRFSPRLGTFAGKPKKAGLYHVTVEARDALGGKSKKKLALSVR